VYQVYIRKIKEGSCRNIYMDQVRSAVAKAKLIEIKSKYSIEFRFVFDKTITTGN
jgi:hypothetical protein